MKNFIINILIKLLEYLADDYSVLYSDKLEYNYDNIPDELIEITYKSISFDFYKDKDKDKVIKWLNNEC